MTKYTFHRQSRDGTATRKALLLLLGGVALGLSGNPIRYARVLKVIRKEWQAIEREKLYRAIRRLYDSRLIRYHEHPNGSVEIVLTDSGKERALRYKLEDMKVPKSERWDGMWRIVSFDVPEKHDKRTHLRDALRRQLKRIGFLEFQKSAFIIPYECRNEIDFVVELFSARPYVRFIVATHIDNELHLKKKFRLL